MVLIANDTLVLNILWIKQLINQNKAIAKLHCWIWMHRYTTHNTSARILKMHLCTYYLIRWINVLTHMCTKIQTNTLPFVRTKAFARTHTHIPSYAHMYGNALWTTWLISQSSPSICNEISKYVQIPLMLFVINPKSLQQSLSPPTPFLLLASHASIQIKCNSSIYYLTFAAYEIRIIQSVCCGVCVC